MREIYFCSYLGAVSDS